MGRHGHDRAGAVARQHVVGDPDRHPLLVCRIDGIRASEHTGFFLREIGAFQVALACSRLAIFLHSLALFIGSELIHILMFR